MNFRQRIAWLLVATFLAATCGLTYYIFEISERFGVYALEHVEAYHSARSRDKAAAAAPFAGAALPADAPGGKGSVIRGMAGHPAGGAAAAVAAAAAAASAAEGVGGDSDGWVMGLGRHLVDIPLAVWLLLLALPYLQVFCLLLACTRPEPRYSPAYLWPLLLYLRCRTLYHRWTHPVAKAVNSPVANGHGGHALLIET